MGMRQKVLGPRGPKTFNLKGGAEGDRTPDLCIANAALSQLSYRPNRDAESSFWGAPVNQKLAAIGVIRSHLFCFPIR